MNFDYTEEQTLLDNMVTSFVRDNYDWDTRCNIVKSEAVSYTHLTLPTSDLV